MGVLYSDWFAKPLGCCVGRVYVNGAMGVSRAGADIKLSSEQRARFTTKLQVNHPQYKLRGFAHGCVSSWPPEIVGFSREHLLLEEQV